MNPDESSRLSDWKEGIGGMLKKYKSDLEKMQEDVRRWIKEKGWDAERTFGDDMALLMSEPIEALEAYRSNGFEEWVTYQPVINGVKMPKMTGDQLVALGIEEMDWGQPRREGVGPELAGTLVRLLDTASRLGISLAEEFQKEMDYNWTRTFRHGNKAL